MVKGLLKHAVSPVLVPVGCICWHRHSTGLAGMMAQPSLVGFIRTPARLMEILPPLYTELSSLDSTPSGFPFGDCASQPCMSLCWGHNSSCMPGLILPCADVPLTDGGP